MTNIPAFRACHLQITALALVILAGLFVSTVARADISACTSASVKESLEDQIRLYTICLTKGGMDAKQLAWAFNNRGVAYYRSGDMDRALADLSKSIHYDPEWGLPLMVRGLIYLHHGQLDLAELDFTSSLQRTLNRPRDVVLANRGLIRMSRGNCVGALEDFTEAQKRNGKTPWTYAAKAWVMSTCADGQRNGADALQAAQKALSMHDNWKFHDALAAAYAELGQFQDAARELKVAQASIGTDESGSNWRNGLSARLALYESGHAYREHPTDAIAAEWMAVSDE
jgi:Flp pilus assembly protein TadD